MQQEKLLGKYTVEKVLGKGAYGQVVLVTTPEKQERAIKLIEKKMLQEEQFLVAYLEDEIQSMLHLSSPYIVKLYNVEEDLNYKYLICQYCNGGDLLHQQAKQPNKVFNLEKATQIIAEVLKGLEFIHQKKYLHRDIKSQNILIHEQNGKKYFKLADFGFAKRLDDVRGTVLGTQPYMAPEIFDQDQYSFEVDMWALGVLFYFMLNMEFPFKFSNPYLSNTQKRDQLKKQARNFSYSAYVQKSKKKIRENCTPELQDIFKKFFETDTDRRLDFVSLREQSLFTKYFPNISPESRILYGQKVTAWNINSFADKDGAKKYFKKRMKKQPKFDEQEAFIEAKRQKIKIISEFEKQISQSDLFDCHESLPLRYCLQTYYTLLLKNLVEQKLRPIQLSKENQNIDWEKYFQTEQFACQRDSYKAEINNIREELQMLKSSCKKQMNRIEQVCPDFGKLLNMPAHNPNFDHLFKSCYHLCTQYSYGKIRKLYESKKKNQYLNLLTIITIAHSYHILKDESPEKLRTTLKPFKSTQYRNLKQWIWMTNDENKKDIIQSIISSYYT